MVGKIKQVIGNKVRNVRSKFKWRRYLLIPVRNASELCQLHFETYSNSDHVNRVGIEKCLDLLAEKPVNIIETGTSAWGTDSTRLWTKYISTFGGNLWTIDIREEPSITLGKLSPNVEFIVDDSVSALGKLAVTKSVGTADLVYLDSWDVDWLDPLMSAEHGLREWKELSPFVQKGTLVLIDDTPCKKIDLENVGITDFTGVDAFERQFGMLPGKGAFVLALPEINTEWEVLHHEYNLLLRKK